MSTGERQSGRHQTPLAELLAELNLPNKALARKMVEHSQSDGREPISPDGSTIARYKAGVHRPKERSLEVLLAVLNQFAGREVTAAELGYAEPESPLVQGIDECLSLARPSVLTLVPEPIDPAFVQHLQLMLTEHVRMDAWAGPRYIIESLRGQLTVVEDLCGKARGEMRASLLEIGARFCEFAGWLFQDSGDLKTALYWTNQAMDYAEELGDTHLISYVLMRKSNILTDAGKAAQGLGLANAALRRWDEITPELRAVALRQLSNAHALFGEKDECRRALDSAMAQVLDADPDDPGRLAKYCTPSYIEMEAAQSWVLLGEPERAITTYSSGLADWPEAQRRDQGLCSARLASAYVRVGELEESMRVATRAVELYQLAPSARSLSVLRDLSKRLSTARGKPVNELKGLLARAVQVPRGYSVSA
ncbi:hypothetical protein [Nocardia sp. CC201C]|uniref:tetratricopeptide repeat protein n=1 Tax=Nocardia sp. CC201C TaxID=3044575 RepID=UPI0024A7F549|nr:hypothetical protein [Nocardia sp. CC201C]